MNICYDLIFDFQMTEDFAPSPNHPGPPPATGIQGIVIVNFHAYNCAARPLRKKILTSVVVIYNMVFR